jgi:hypothetical protein
MRRLNQCNETTRGFTVDIDRSFDAVVAEAARKLRDPKTAIEAVQV